MADRELTLEEQSEIQFPMPPNPCPWNRKRVLWERERWIKNKLAQEKTK